MTDVPPNASQLAEHGGAELIPHSAEALAGAVERLLDSPAEWRRRREAALAMARDFDLQVIFGPALESIGFATR
jgi:glycosyltransferase involved in cell wall biosynthesis